MLAGLLVPLGAYGLEGVGKFGLKMKSLFYNSEKIEVGWFLRAYGTAKLVEMLEI